MLHHLCKIRQRHDEVGKTNSKLIGASLANMFAPDLDVFFCFRGAFLASRSLPSLHMDSHVHLIQLWMIF